MIEFCIFITLSIVVDLPMIHGNQILVLFHSSYLRYVYFLHQKFTVSFKATMLFLNIHVCFMMITFYFMLFIKVWACFMVFLILLVYEHPSIFYFLASLVVWKIPTLILRDNFSRALQNRVFRSLAIYESL